MEALKESLLLKGFKRYRKFEVIIAFSTYIRMLNYLFLTFWKKLYNKFYIIFWKGHIFFGKWTTLIFFLTIYSNAEIIGNMHLFPLHNEPSTMPVGWKLWEELALKWPEMSLFISMLFITCTATSDAKRKKLFFFK